MSSSFKICETTIAAVHRAFKSGKLTCHQLVQTYLDRIEAYDRHGPGLNSIITLNPQALGEADRLDAVFKASGPTGPLHGIPVVVKDQADAKGMPTTLGSLLFKDYYPDRDCFVVEKLKKAGAIILAKGTLGELGAGDTHGSLFGSTRNPYSLERTAGGSSGGPATAVSANLATIGVGQEGFSSIRRPAAWNCINAMRPTAGLVSRGGVYSGWPDVAGSLGPMARTVADLAILLDSMIGYDSEDPLTARGFGYAPASYVSSLDKDGLKGKRLGVLREAIGAGSDPETEDFKKVSEVLDSAVQELRTAGATIVDPIVIPNLKPLLSKRAGMYTSREEAFQIYYGRSARMPYQSREEVAKSPHFPKVHHSSRQRWVATPASEAARGEYLRARDELMTHLLKVMADNRLDAIVYKAVEHQPSLIKDGVTPPYVDIKGASFLNTFLVYVPVVVVPASFSSDNLPAAIAFLGRPYSDAEMIRLAYAYEQATRHRRPPECAPEL